MPAEPRRALPGQISRDKHGQLRELVEALGHDGEISGERMSPRGRREQALTCYRFSCHGTGPPALYPSVYVRFGRHTRYPNAETEPPPGTFKPFRAFDLRFPGRERDLVALKTPGHQHGRGYEIRKESGRAPLHPPALSPLAASSICFRSCKAVQLISDLLRQCCYSRVITSWSPSKVTTATGVIVDPRSADLNGMVKDSMLAPAFTRISAKVGEFPA